MAGYMPQVMFAVVPPSVLVPPIAAPVGIDIATEAVPETSSVLKAWKSTGTSVGYML